MKPFRAIACSAAVVAAAAVQAPYASATVVHERESTHRVVTSEHDLNICGDLATFTFESTGHSTAVDTGDGFHFSLRRGGLLHRRLRRPGTWHMDSSSD